MTQAAIPAGEKPPAPTFDAIPLGADVRKAVDALGYVHPTPVQLAQNHHPLIVHQAQADALDREFAHHVTSAEALCPAFR